MFIVLFSYSKIKNSQLQFTMTNYYNTNHSYRKLNTVDQLLTLSITPKSRISKRQHLKLLSTMNSSFLSPTILEFSDVVIVLSKTAILMICSAT